MHTLYDLADKSREIAGLKKHINQLYLEVSRLKGLLRKAGICADKDESLLGVGEGTKEGK